MKNRWLPAPARPLPRTWGVAIGELLLVLPPSGSPRSAAVLVFSGEKEEVFPALAHVTGEDVCGHRRVGVPEGGARLLVDRGGT